MNDEKVIVKDVKFISKSYYATFDNVIHNYSVGELTLEEDIIAVSTTSGYLTKSFHINNLKKRKIIGELTLLHLNTKCFTFDCDEINGNEIFHTFNKIENAYENDGNIIISADNKYYCGDVRDGNEIFDQQLDNKRLRSIYLPDEVI